MLQFKNIRRILTVVLIISLSLVTFSASANELVLASEIQMDSLTNDEISNAIISDYPLLISSLKESPDAYGYASSDLDGISFLNPVRFITSDSNIEDLQMGKMLYTLHIPLINKNNEIIAIYTVIKTDNGINSTIGKDFAPMLNKAKSDGITSAALFQNTSGLYLSSCVDQYTINMKLTKVTEFADSQVIINNSIKGPYIIINLSEINQALTDDAKNVMDSWHEGKSISISNQTVEIESNNITSTTEVQNFTDPITENTVLSYPTSKYLSNYPIVDQNVNGVQRGLCWAATVASMCRFEKPSTWGSLTAQNVADYCNIGYDDGGTNGDAIYALNHYLGSPYVPTATGVLSTSSIQVVINNIDPAYMQCRKKTGFWPWQFSYHAVALTGYNYSSGYVIQLMDPAYECFKASTRAANGSWSFAFGDTSFTWYRTVRLLYSV